MTTNTTTKKVTIKLTARALLALLGDRIPVISESDHYAGLTMGARKDSVAVHKALVATVTEQVAEGGKNVVLDLTKHEAAVLFYATTIGGGSTYESGNVLNNKTYEVIVALGKAGFPFPARELVY